MNHDRDEDQGNFDTLDELDEYYDDDYEGNLLRWVSIGFVLVAVIGFVTLAWYAYQSGMEPVSEDEIPLVEADDSPIKEEPKDPGGWQFEHQDKSVYNQLAAGENDRKVAERLLPAPEEPVQRPPVEEILAKKFEKEPVNKEIIAAPEEEAKEAAGAAMVAMDSKAKVIKVPDAPAPNMAEMEKKPETGKVETEDSTVTVVPSHKESKSMAVIEPKPVAKPQAPETKPAAKTAPIATTVAKPGQFMVQLASFRSHEDAEAAWARIKKAHGSMFPTKRHTIQRADLGAKGVYHRLQMGPFDTDAAAKKVCAYLQEHKQGCLVVKVK